MIDPKKYILTKQQVWAKRHKIQLVGSQKTKGEKNYVQELEDNLFLSPDSDLINEFNNADGNELSTNGKSLPKMHAVHSSSAIAVNFFYYWRSKEKLKEIMTALRLISEKNNNSFKLKFEDIFKITGVGKSKANIDVTFTDCKNNRIYAIECKFTEPFSKREEKVIPFAKKYFEENSILNKHDKLLDYVTKLKEEYNYNYFSPEQIIKHFLGLLSEGYKKSDIRIDYLYYDVLGDAGCKHNIEMEKFNQQSKDFGLDFRTISYQELFINLYKKYHKGNETYIDWLGDRYF